MKFKTSAVAAAMISIISSTPAIAGNVSGKNIIVNGDVRFNGSAANNNVTINKITKTIDVSDQFKTELKNIGGSVSDVRAVVEANSNGIEANLNRIGSLDKQQMEQLSLIRTNEYLVKKATDDIKGLDSSLTKNSKSIEHLEQAFEQGEGKVAEYVDDRLNKTLSNGQKYVDDKFVQVDNNFEEASRAMQVVANQISQNHQHIGENRQRIEENRAAIEDAKNSGGSEVTEADIAKAGEYVDSRMNTALSHGKEYVDDKFQQVDNNFEEANRAIQVAANQIALNHQHIGENRQRIEENRAAIEDAKNSGGSVITEADIKAARTEANQIAANVANKAIEDAVNSVEIDDETVKAAEVEVAKVAQKAIADAVSKIDTDKALKDFFDTLEKHDRAIRGDASKAYTQLDGRIDANAKAIKELDDRVSVLENQIHGFKDMVNNNAAMTNALSALPQPYGVGKVQVGVGFGFADDANAVAVGAGYRVSEHMVIRAGISKSAGNSGSIQGNVGVGFEF